MRLLYVHERFGALAGAEANVYITAQEFLSRGHVLGILHGPGTGKNEEGWRHLFSDRFALEKDSTAESASNALIAFRPDAVFVHKMADLRVIQTLVDSGLPLVRMVHDHDIYCMRSYKYFYFSRKICTRPASLACVFPCGAFLVRNRDGRWPLKYVSYSDKRREIELNRQFHRHLVVTHYMKAELAKNGFDPARIEIFPPVPRPGDASIRSSFGDRNLILFAGQIVRGKGVDILLECLARVRVRFECVILGDGNHRADCEKLSHKLGLTDRVQFNGFVPQEELKRYYAECSVVAISSVWPEPIATIGLEVMRYGLPVVAFDAGGIRDWLRDGENGFLVPWMDRDQFARRLEELLENKSLARRMGENGLALVNKEYNFDQYIGRLENLFCRVMTEVKPGPEWITEKDRSAFPENHARKTELPS
jgi:glycosyltransferase involved in cell wall biosynthesis